VVDRLRPIGRSRCRPLPAVDRRLAGTAAGCLAAAVALGACSSRYGVPEPATRQGGQVLDLWRVLFLAAVALGAVVAALIGWAVIRYRRRPDGQAAGFSENVPLELFYTGVPLAIVAVLFGVTVATQRDVNRLAPHPELRVEVTGFQWGWRFRYLNEGVLVVGTSGNVPTMVLPVDQTARLTLLSPDVIHAFYVPEFLVKRDVIPGVENRIDVTPTRTGRFGGVCAEFCGLDHSRMNFTVEVVEAPAFEAWLQQLQREQATTTSAPPQGRPDPGRQAAPEGAPTAARVPTQ
jgi:cytochrome c oxidase subunit 2